MTSANKTTNIDTVKNGLEIDAGQFRLKNVPDADATVSTYFGKDGSGNWGLHALPAGSAQDALNGIRTSAHATLQAAATAARAATKPVIVDSVVTYDIADADKNPLTGSAALNTDAAQQAFTRTLSGPAVAVNADLPIQKTISADGANSTVPRTGVLAIPATAHGLQYGDYIAITGSPSNTFDKIYKVLDDSPANYIHIADSAAAVVAFTSGCKIKWQLQYRVLTTYDLYSTVTPGSVSNAVTNDYNGMVGMTVFNHGLHKGMIVSIRGTTNYNGEYEIGEVVDKDTIRIYATFAAENLTDAFQLGVCGTHVRNRGWSNFITTGTSARDVGDGTVGIQCPGQSFPVGTTVTISGTTNYNGTFTTVAAFTNEFTITTAYVAETFSNSGIVRADKLVGIPVRNHGMNRLSTAVISGTTNYDGEYPVYRLSGFFEINELIVEAAYVAEEFTTTGTADLKETVIPTSTTNSFVVGDTVQINNTTNYDGAYTVLARTNSTITIDKVYVAETFAAPDEVQLVLVQIPTTNAHSFNSNSTIKIAETTNYNGYYNLKIRTVPSANLFTLSLPLTAETFSSGYVANAVLQADFTSDLTFIFPNEAHYIIFADNLSIHIHSQFKMSPHQRCFAMANPQADLVNRTRFTVTNGMKCHVQNWGANPEDSQADAVDTAWKIINCWNFAQSAQYDICLGDGVYTIGVTIEEDVNVEGLGVSKLCSDSRGVIHAQIRSADNFNQPLLVMHTNNWHNAILSEISFKGEDGVNKHMQPEDSLVVLEGYNWKIEDLQIKDCKGIGLSFNGGQSNGIWFDNVEIEGCDVGLMLQGSNVVDVMNCSFEQNRIAIRMRPATNSTYENPWGAKAVIEKNYIEANKQHDIEILGIDNVHIGKHSRSATAKFIHIGHDWNVNVPSIACTVDLDQTVAATIQVHEECLYTKIVMPTYPNNTRIVLQNRSKSTVYDRKGANPYAIPITEDYSGTVYAPWSTPVWAGGALVTDPFGDGTNRWNGTHLIDKSVGYVDVNNGGAVIRSNTRWQTNVHNTTINAAQGVVLAAGTYYVRAIVRVPLDWVMITQVWDSVNNLYYHHLDEEFSIAGSEASSRSADNIFFATTGEYELVQYKLNLKTSRTILVQYNFLSYSTIVDPDSSPVIEYFQITDNPKQGLVHTRNNVVVAHGKRIDPNESVQVSGTYTLKNHEVNVMLDSSGGAFTVSMPTTPVDGQTHYFCDTNGSAGANNVTLDRNGKSWDGGTGSGSVSVNYETRIIKYSAAGQTWLTVN